MSIRRLLNMRNSNDWAHRALPFFAGSTNRFEEVIGAEAALLLLEEMKVSAGDSGAVPDIFTYTTVISGMARAEASGEAV